MKEDYGSYIPTYLEQSGFFENIQVYDFYPRWGPWSDDLAEKRSGAITLHMVADLYHG